MMKFVVFLGLLSLALAEQLAGDDNDDGSYVQDKYENPYKYFEQEGYQQQSQQAPQQQQGYYQPQAQARPAYRAAQPAYRAAQPAYQPQSSYNSADPRTASILEEARYLSADGKFGASYTQEDGVQFKEEALPDGTRKGSYSYIAPDGTRKTVSYTAGKNGFVPEGDHLPEIPNNAPQPEQPAYQAPQAYRAQPQPTYQARAQPAYQPQAQPAYRPQPQQAYRAQPAPVYQAQPEQSYQQPAYQPQPKYAAAPAAAAPETGHFTYNNVY